ncbi:glycosyltransferase [bacterium]|nr:MAG: glycosyltransferase [bacterium]
MSIAVLLPCYNEELTIGKVVREFRQHLPTATVYVFDNNSKDRTAEIARAAGAHVVPSPIQGKGNVVRHMFETVDADIYVMADGDDTYPPEFAPGLIREQLDSGADMVVGTRLTHHHDQAFPALHGFGNKLISGLIAMMFSSSVTDVLSGYRVFSRNFIRSVYLEASGFEIETELTLQALVKNLTIREITVRYDNRPEGSDSKLDTFSDGARILRAIFMLFKEYKPFVFFTTISVICFIAGLIVGWFPIKDYIETNYVSHVPLALLAASLEILAVLCFGIGLILNSIIRSRFETLDTMKKLFRHIDKLKQQ